MKLPMGSSESSCIRVRIRYLLRGEQSPRELALAPEEYFDPPETAERLTVRSEPRHWLAHRYLAHRPDELCWTVLEVADGADWWRVRTQFLDGVRSMMQHSEQSDGREEIIHSTELSEGCDHTIRTLKNPSESWAVVGNSVHAERSGPFQSRGYCGGMSFEELQEFGSV